MSSMFDLKRRRFADATVEPPHLALTPRMLDYDSSYAYVDRKNWLALEKGTFIKYIKHVSPVVYMGYVVYTTLNIRDSNNGKLIMSHIVPVSSTTEHNETWVVDFGDIAYLWACRAHVSS